MNLFSNNNGYSTGEIYWNEQPINKIYFRDNIIFRRVPRIDFILPCLADDNIICEEGNYDRYYWNQERSWTYYSINYVKNYFVDEGEEEYIPEYENIFNNFYNNYYNHCGVYPVDPLITYHGVYNSNFNNEALLNLFMFQTNRLNNETYNYTILEYDGDYVSGVAESSVIIYKTLNQYIKNYYYTTNVVKLVNNISQMVNLDDTQNPIEYKWFNYVYNNNDVQVSIAAPYGNYRDPTSGNIENNVYLGQFENFPLYFYCENSNKIYYNANPFGGNAWLDQSDLTQGPKYDYVSDTMGINLFPGSEYINVNFKRITEFNNYFQAPYSLRLPLVTPYITNLASAYYARRSLEKAWCSDAVADMSYAYYACSNIIGKPVCGNNVVNMRGAYEYCQKIGGKAVCGPNVIDMVYSYYNTNITVPNIGPKVKNADYAFGYCTNLRKEIITPSLENADSMYTGINTLNIVSVEIERNDSNLNILGTMGSLYRIGGQNVTKIEILSNGNFATFANVHIDENGSWNYLKSINSYWTRFALPFYDLRVLYIPDGFKDISNFFNVSSYYDSNNQINGSGCHIKSLSNLKNYYIPNSIEDFHDAFCSTGIKHFLHSNNGGKFFRNTYKECALIAEELYIPQTAECIDGIIAQCHNVPSVNIDRECKIPGINTTYDLNNIGYSDWTHPFLNCRNIIDLKLSNYMVLFNSWGCFSYMSYSPAVRGLDNNYKLKNIVFYNNDNNTIKNLDRAFIKENSLPKSDGTYLDLYVPDSTNENSFNYLFYTRSGNIFYEYNNEVPLEWTMFENGYYNEQYKVRVLNNYDYTNDKFREV